MKHRLVTSSAIVCLSLLLLEACRSAPTATPVAVSPTATAAMTLSTTPTLTPTQRPSIVLTRTPKAIEEVMGTVQYGELVYMNDFEDSKKLNEVRLNLNIPHEFVYEGEGGARMWVEDSFAHSGAQCIGVEVFDISKSRRNEFNIDHLETLTGDEYSVSVWLFFPTDFSLNVPGVDWNWMEFLVLSEDVNPPAYLPILRLQLTQSNIARENLDISINLLDVNGIAHVLDRVNDFPLPLGEWFSVHYYVNRNPSQSNAKVWINGLLLFDVYDIPIKEVDSFFTTIAKVYYDEYDTVAHRIWADDLRIFKGFSMPAGASPTDLSYREGTDVIDE